jgi:Glycosyltransferase family 87
MSVAEDALKPPRRRDPPLAGVGSTIALRRLPVYVACTVLALVTNYLLGKDLAWDTLNYQLYAGFSAINDRFAQDYFAAGPPSYFNPYAYVPFYVLVRAALSPLEISSALAVAHSVILWLTFELAVCVCPSNDRRMQMTYGICAIAMAFVNPILVQQIGSSFADITTAELVLGGWLLLAHAVRTPHAARIVAAGVLLGTATALKLTNSVHAIASFALLTMLPQTLYGRFRSGLGYAAALGLGFTIVAAPWSYRLEKMFGNPLFPLMNDVFHSPEFTTEPLRHFRFIPESFAKALWRPFAMVDPAPLVQEELAAPDLRYAVLVVLIGVLFLSWLLRRSERPSTLAARVEPAVAGRVLAALGFGLATDWVLWLSASGNGRYFLPMASVAGVLVIALVFRLFGSRTKVRNYILVTIIGAELVQLCFGANYRWNSVPWDGEWLTMEIPDKLATEPNLYLTVGVQSNSFVAPFLAKDSGLVNFSGGYAFGPEGANGARIEALIRRYAPRLRVLWGDAQPQMKEALSRFGLRVDTSDCATITVRGLPSEAEGSIQSRPPVAPGKQPPRSTSYLTSCHLVPDNTDSSARVAREHAVDVVFDRVEDACPTLFQPRRLPTEYFVEFWRRYYVNTDLVVMISHGTVKFLDPVRGGQMVYLGLESDWAKAPLQLACGRRDYRYFANVLKSSRK